MPHIPNCSHCEDEGKLKSFIGFYQERYGQRRTIDISGCLSDYSEVSEASQNKSIKCRVCGWRPEAQKVELWAKNYGWSWPDTPESVPFDAKQISLRLEQYYRKLGSNVIHLTLQKSDIKYAEFPKQIHTKTAALFRDKLHVHQLYSYQAEAISSIYKNRITVVQAPTGAGKSLIYQIYYLNALQNNKNARLLALFPTQALTKDQSKAFIKLSAEVEQGIPSILQEESLKFDDSIGALSIALLCGKDDEVGKKNATAELLKKLKKIHVLFGTPDKLYVQLYKEQFKEYLKNLELIVVDEAHMATGIFGGNFAYLIRRLLKLSPKAKLLVMSATFSSVKDFAKVLCGESGNIIDGRNTHRTNRELLLVPLWPHQKKKENNAVVNPSTAVLETIAKIIEYNNAIVPNGIIFGRSKRELAHLVRLMEKRIAEKKYPLQLTNLPKIYKRDLESEKKDELLRQMHDREISMMFSTNALELGIDVGGIDFVILDMLPDSDLSFMQRIGRAGRSRDGIAIAFVDADPYQQFWLENVSATKKIDIANARPLPIALANPNIIRNNYIRFAWEARTHLGVTDINEIKKIVSKWSGIEINKAFDQLFQDGKDLADFVYVEKLKKDPVSNNLVAMRVAVNVDEISIIDKNSGKQKGSVSLGNFFRDLHEGAVWPDENNVPFRVIDFANQDKTSGIPQKAIVITEPNKDRRTYGVVKIRQTDEIAGMPPKELAKGGDYFIRHGAFKIEEKSPGYYESVGDKSKFVSYDENSKMNFIKRPKYETLGLLIHNDKWITDKPTDIEKAALEGFLSIFQNIASHHVGASDGDIKYSYSHVNGNVYVLDSSAGGNGVSFQVAKDMSIVLEICKKILRSCKCKNGCFGCIWPRYTDIANASFSKKRTIDVIDWLSGVCQHVNI